MIMLIAKIMLFLFSFLGLNLMVSKLLHIKIEFAPILTISSISIILLFAGMFNLLYVGSLIIYLGGFISLVVCMIIDRNQYKNRTLFVIVSIILIILLYLSSQAKLMHYDNFSHWALIVKDMLNFNELPSQANGSIVTFITYPAGSALFIYYVARFISASEHIIIFAQALITFFSVLPFAVLIRNKNKKMMSYVIFALLLVIAFTINIHLSDLLVDTILATVGGAITIILYEYRKDVKKALPIIIPIMIFLVLTKNSGIFFVVGNMVIYFYYYIVSKQYTVSSSIITVVCFFVTFLFIKVWGIHVQMSYSPELVHGAKHTLSISSYLNNFDLLDMQAIKAITTVFFKEIFNFKNHIILTLYCVDIVMLGYIILSKTRKFIVWSSLNLFLIVYIISLWAMYLFSMPYNEAIDLASFDRYLATFLLYFIIVLFVLFMLEKNMTITLTCALITFFITILWVCDISSLYTNKYQGIAYASSGCEKVDKMISEYLDSPERDTGKTVVVLISDSLYSNDYYSFYIRYYLHSENFVIVNSEDNINIISDYVLLK